MAASDETAFELPRLRVSVCLENDTRFLGSEDEVAEFFDVKFCPYQPLDCDPVFAVISKKHVVICRLSQNGETNPCEILTVIRDDDDEALACCCTWTQDPVSGRPLLCVGGRDAKVKIYDIVEGKLFKCFTGHGGDVNDLATSPVNPSIIASASQDTSIRIWSLDPKYEGRECLCMFTGEGHSWDLLSVSFHETGRYILSAGHDQVINLWTVPDLPTEPIDRPIRIHYPHFSTSAIHSGIVDCVAFYGDQILSRACHDNTISLWRIEGFSSSDPPPTIDQAPTAQSDDATATRSAWIPAVTPECPAQYTRLIEFDTPNCGPQFFMRFKLHCVPDMHPVLAFCNAGGNIFFWDFKRLTTYHEFMDKVRDPNRDKSVPLKRPGWLKPVVHRQRIDAAGPIRSRGLERDAQAPQRAQTPQTPQTPSLADGVSGQSGQNGQNGQTPEASEYNIETLKAWASRYSVEDPHEPLKAHRLESSTANFVGRQAAWSPGGEWCVVVGSSNQTLILQRWAKKPPPKNSESARAQEPEKVEIKAP